MENFEEAEKFYRIVLKNNETDPKAYYTLANFYAKYQKYDEAEKMYEDRIALDAKDPAGYLFYANYLQNRGKWDESILTHEKRLITFLNPEILSNYSQIDKLNKDIYDMGKKREYMDNVKRNKSIDKKTRDDLINAKLKEIEELGLKPVEELKKELAVKKKEIDALREQAEQNLTTLPDETKAKLAETYYRIGYVHWAKSYQTQEDWMDKNVRAQVIEDGLNAMDKALLLDPEFPNPYSYKGLLWREKIKVNKSNRNEYIRKNEEFNAKFISLWKKRQQQLEYQRSLEDQSKEK